MPIYSDLPTIALAPSPELPIRELWMYLNPPPHSVLDVGAGHGGPFDCGFIEQFSSIDRYVACDIHWIRPMQPMWETRLGVDVQDLKPHFMPRSFDLVFCMETLEHVENPRLALEQLLYVTNKVCIITSADIEHHLGPEQEAIEKINPHQRFIAQPKVEDLLELGFTVCVDAETRRQLIAWKYV